MDGREHACMDMCTCCCCGGPRMFFLEAARYKVGAMLFIAAGHDAALSFLCIRRDDYNDIYSIL